MKEDVGICRDEDEFVMRLYKTLMRISCIYLLSQMIRNSACFKIFFIVLRPYRYVFIYINKYYLNNNYLYFFLILFLALQHILNYLLRYFLISAQCLVLQVKHLM